MVFLYRPNCPNCPNSLKDLVASKTSHMFQVVTNPVDGTPYIRMGAHEYAPLLSTIPALPALIVGEKNVYIGERPIKEYMEKLA